MKPAIVMVVDDDTDDLEFLCDAVTEVDAVAECISCISGAAALDLLQQDDSIIPDYIFMDLNMPRMNGKQCLLEIKKLPRFSNTHFIMYTTSRLTDDIREAKKIGVHFINKPNSFSALRTIIAQVFNKSWAAVEVR